jgi:hypothetical protein
MNLKDKFDLNRKINQRELANTFLILIVYMLGQILCYVFLGDRHIITFLWVFGGASFLIMYALKLILKNEN